MISADLWTLACQVLRWHNQPGHTCIDTVNRLWRKSPWVGDTSILPIIQEEQIVVTEESWDLGRLWPLVHQRQLTSNTPASTTSPIILVRWFDKDFLLDGRTRINHWKRTANIGPHDVLVIHA